MIKKIIIILVIVVILASATVVIYLYLQEENIIVNPNLPEEYRQTLEADLQTYANELLDDPSNIESYIKIGTTQQKLGLLSQAEGTFKRALKLPADDKQYLLYLYLGKLYDDMEKFDKADETLRVSTQINPNTPAGFLALIDLYKKHYPEKADELDNIYRAASDYAQSSEIWASYAQFLEDRREYRQAWIYWQEVLRVEPENAVAIEHVQNLEGMLSN
ncbi:hypothetical protein KKF64_02575 [Patescibacteria group bacterium]|nr:hypothetical protein [Patescibacteria group bacterium]